MTRPNTKRSVPTLRAVAADVLEAVYRRGGFAAAELDGAFRTHVSLSPVDRALLTELVYGVLRTRGALEPELRQLAKQGIAGNDHKVTLHVLLAAYQLTFLTRVPAYAAISEAVTLVRRLRGDRVGGFCNALLRRFAERPKLSMPEAIERNCPSWLMEELRATVGDEDALSLLGAGEVSGSARGWIPTPTLRLRAGAAPMPWLADATPGVLVPSAYRVVGGGDLQHKPEYSEGQFIVQDEGSMFAALALGARRDERVLDCCAGRGQKASLLAEQIGPGGLLHATDKGEAKLAQLQREFERLSLPQPCTRAVDWTQGSDDLPRDFDRVLVDAPCTGTGTLRRRPEISLRLQPNDVDRLATLAETILRRASEHVRPGGRVVFVVCSVLAREGERVIERVADVLRPVPFDVQHPAVAAGVTHVRLLPRVHGTDGFFIASFQRGVE